MARVEDASSEEEDEPEVIIEDDATEQEEVDNESEASDDMSEGDEAERALERRVQELEEQIQKNPYVYDDHIQLIESLDKLSELERMREAFERLHGVSALAAEHWLLRVQTEAALAHTPAERRAVQELYRRAATETYYIPLYVEWCTFGLGGGEEEARGTLRAALRRTGADPTGGRLMWDTLKEHERERLKLLSEESEGYGEQVVRVARCLAEQLTRPLLSVPTAAEELRELVAAHGTHLREGYLEKILAQHEQVKEIRDQLSVYEDRLLTAENVDEKCEIYREYIEKVRQLQEEEREEESPFSYDELHMVLYDRATYDCMSCELPASDALYTEYGRLARSLEPEEYARALEVCVGRRPRLAEFWVLSVQRLEREGKDFEEVKSTLEKALSYSLPQEGYLAVWMSYLECLRRRTDFAVPEQCETLRQNMRLACTALHELWGETGDPECSVLTFWARLEYGRMGDHVRGKELFEEMFQSPHNKTLSQFWLALIELESARSPRPADRKLRDLHARALRFVADYPPAVARRWEDFERDRGTLESLLQCRAACQEKVKEWRESFEAQKEKKNQKGNKNKSKFQDKKTKGNDQKSGKKQKAGGSGDGAEEKPPDKGVKGGTGKKRAAEGGAGGEDAKRKREGEGEATARRNGDLKRSHDAEEPAVSKRLRVSGDASPGGAQNGDAKPAVGAEKEACTLFVSNLDFKFDEGALRKGLDEWGTVVSMRVVRGVKAFGGSICYCEYTTPEAVEEAVKHDRAPLDGRPMFLSKYRAERERPRFRYATAPERNKLFVRNLPFADCTEERLREVFAPHGELRDVRIVTHKDGRPKGLAYIEYADEKAASAALLATDGLLMGERALQVALSAPPPRALSAPTTSLGQGRRDAAGPRKSQLSNFLPRALQKPTAATANPSAPSTSGASKPMTNSDFRDMLLNK